MRRASAVYRGLLHVLPTDFRRLLFRLSKDRLKVLDPRWRSSTVSEQRKQAWFLDQYRNPHESKHTLGEVLGWFDACGLEFIHGIPKPKALEAFSAHEQLFEPDPRGSALDHLIVQLGMLLGGGREGGLFMTIGCRR